MNRTKKNKLVHQLKLLVIVFFSHTLFGQSIPTNGLIAHYPLSPTFSNGFNQQDVSLNGFTATSWFTPAPVGSGRTTSGSASQAMQFDNNYVYRDYTGNEAQFQQTGDFTISAWIYEPSQTTYTNTYENIVVVGNTDMYLRIYHNGASHYLQGGYRTGASSWANVQVTLNLSTFTNQWQHVSLTRTGTSLTIWTGYFQGASVTSAPAVVHTTNAAQKSFRIGHDQPLVGTTKFKGRIQDVTYYNRGLSQLELIYYSLCGSINPPTNTTTQSIQNICPGTNVQLSAATLPNTNTINWYTSSVGGSPIATGTNFSPGIINANTTYYVDASQFINTSTYYSYPRLPIVITVASGIPANPTNTSPTNNLTICPGTTTTLSATGNSLTWYSTPTGGTSLGTGFTFTTPTLSSATTYYVQDGLGACASNRTAITVNMAAAPAAPTNTSNAAWQLGCGFRTTYLTATGSSTISWFDVPSGGTALGTGTSFTTPNLPNPSQGNTTIATYYVETTNSCGQVSPRTAIPITVSYNYPATVTPAATLTVCNGATVDLGVNTIAPASSVSWYQGVSAVLGTGFSYTTPPITSSTTNIWDTYYALIPSPDNANCEMYLPFTIQMTNTPAPNPTNTTVATNLSVCNGGATTLTATGSGTLYWFNSPTGGTQIGTGTSFTTAALTSTTTFYVQNGLGNCASSRIAIPVVVKQPSSSTVAQTSCGAYLWNGINRTTSGTYTYLTTNSVGCDSTATLNLTVNQPSSSTTSHTSCGAYLWNGVSRTSSGTYTFTTTNSAGCDSVATLNLVVNQPSASSTNHTSCGSYLWNGINRTASGTYTYTTVNAVGCDSVATLNLVVNQPSTSITNQTSCGSFMWNGINRTTSGTYTYSTTNSVGCDSTATLNLVVNQPSTSSTNHTSCGSYLWNGINRTTSGTYTFTTTNAVGCDSVATLNLVVNQPSSSTTNHTSCGSYMWNGINRTASGTYTFTTTNAIGCDSVATLNLVVNQPSFAVLNQNVCNSSFTLNGQTYTTPGTYTQNLTTVAGCDSTLTIILTFNSATSSSMTVTECGSYSLNNQTYTSSGVYTQNLINVGGCDSILTLNLTILPLPLVGVTNSANELSAEQSGATYQWINCANNSPIDGANAQTFTPTASGSYAVIVSNGNCSDTSACQSVTISTIGIEEQTASNFNIYPNPAQDFVNLNKLTVGTTLQLTDMAGKVVLETIVLTEEMTLDVNDLNNGIYFVHLSNNTSIIGTKKLVLNK